MNTVLEYLEQYGNYTFNEEPINEVDLIMMSQLCYIDYEKSEPDIKNKSFIFKDLIEKVKTNTHSFILGLLVPDTLFPMVFRMGELNRYKNLVIENYENILDNEKIEQFSAMTLVISDNLKVVVFCGTDDTIVGWKENFNMIFTDEVPAQKSAKNYLDKVAKGYNGDIIVTGHSKGGNLSFFAGIHSNRYTKEKLKKVYSFDGQGLTPKDAVKLKKSKYYNKFISYITDCSIVGKLFEHTAKTIICKSYNQGLYQHDSFSWVVDKNRFKRSYKTAKESEDIEKIIKDILDSMDIEERKKFVNAFFSILEQSNVNCLLDIKSKQKMAIVKGYINTSPEDKKLLRDIAGKLIRDKSMRKVTILAFRDLKRTIKKRKQ